MSTIATASLGHVFTRLREVQESLGIDPPASDDPELMLADLLDSMALVELIAVLARDRGVSVEAIERAAGHRLSTVASLAAAAEHAVAIPNSVVIPAEQEKALTPCWLSAPRLYLPARIEESHDLDIRLSRSQGWLESHAGIRRRHLWHNEDVIDAAARVAFASLETAGLLIEDVSGLLVTSQAPPLLIGLGAAIHQPTDHFLTF